MDQQWEDEIMKRNTLTIAIAALLSASAVQAGGPLYTTADGSEPFVWDTSNGSIPVPHVLPYIPALPHVLPYIHTPPHVLLYVELLFSPCFSSIFLLCFLSSLLF